MKTITQNKQGLRILVAGTILQLLLGIIYAWSVFVIPVSEAYQWDISAVKLMASFSLSFFALGMLAGSKLLVKIGTEKTVFAGGTIFAAGMFASAFLPASIAPLMYFTCGIICGFGAGAAYKAITFASQKWFPQDRSFAYGITICALGFSPVIFAPLVQFLVNQFDARNTFVIIAAVFFTAVLALFKFISLPETSPLPEKDLPVEKQYTVKEAVKTKEYFFIIVSLMFLTAAFFILNPSIITFTIERGLGNYTIGTIVVMLFGAANALGRLVLPVFSQKAGREKILFAIAITTAVCSAFLGIADGYLFIAGIVIIAFCFGGLPGIYAELTADYFGSENAQSNYNAVIAGFALSALAFPLLFSLIGDVRSQFLLLAALAASGGKFITLLALSKQRKNDLDEERR